MTQTTRWSTLSHAEIRSAGSPAEDDPPVLGDAAARIARNLQRGALNPDTVSACCAGVDVAALALALVLTAGAPAVAVGAAIAAVFATGLVRGYRLSTLRDPGRALAAALPLWVMAAGLTGVASGQPLSGALLSVTVGALVLLWLRAISAAGVRWILDSGMTERRAVIVGGGGNAERLIRGLAMRPDNDIRICGIFDDRGDDRSPTLVAGCRKLGTVAELVEFARIARIDMLIVTLPLSAEARILSLLGRLWVLPVDIRMSAYSADFGFRRRDDSAGAHPALIDVLRAPLAGGRRALKRLFDLLVGSAALAALSPLMLLTALAIRLDSPGPVLFRQKRHGFNHQAVSVWKFRSLRHDQADPLARSVVTRGDPRVTRVGRIIRKTSIDELPQLFNVLCGDLSLVGPRPHALAAISSRDQAFTEIVDGYSGRHKVPPGITGWAQINGWRGEIDDPEKLRQRFEHDLYYIENWSFWLDVYILLMTPLRLFHTRNAY